LAASRHVVDGDPVRLRQVACNLVKNAVKFTPPNGTIALRTSDGPGDARVRVEVIDTGVGMQPEMLHRMFDPFEQAGRAAESKGLGLGLTICKGLVEAHGGRIAASSRGLGTGMTLTIDLPARAGAASTSADEGRSGGPDAGAASPLQILLVDDHADTLRALSRLLRKLNHTVLTADCVRSALAAAGEHEFDLVISDVGLPDGTGTDLMRELLRRGPIRGIALTGYGTESDVQETRAAGFSAHLTKPIDFAELQAVITRGPRP
jgi:CheY-like chemotaxis protein